MKSKSEVKYDYSAFVYIAPICLIILFMSIIPIVIAFYYSFTNFDGVREPVFAGLNNYRKLFADPVFKASINNTLVFTLVTVPLQTVIAMFLAFWLSTFRQGRWAQFVRGTLFVPVIASSMVAGIIGRAFLAPNALFSTMLGLVGIKSANFLDMANALYSTCAVAIWRDVGYFMVIYFASIMEIPTSLYESADVEGCSFWQKLFYITIPLLNPTTYLVVILGTIWSFQVFDLVYALTQGGPGFSTVTMVMSIYNSAFKQYSMGYASAQAYLLLVIIVLVSVIQTKVLNRSGDSSV